MSASARVDLIVQARDARATARDVDRVARAVDGTGRAAERSARRQRVAAASARAMHGTLRGVGRAATVGVVGIAALGASTVKTAMNFEQSMSAVGAATGAQGTALKQLESQALRAAAATKFAPQEAAAAQAELAKGGVKTADILKGGLNAALSLAAAGELELAEAGVYTANAMNLFGLKGRETGRIADALAMGANATTASVQDFGMALSQGGAVAKSAGLGFYETMVALEALAASGVKSSDAGTSLKTAIGQLLNPTDKSQRLMNKYNLEFVDAAGKMKSLGAISGMLRKELGRMSDAQRTATLMQIAGTDGVRTLTSLYDSTPAKLAKFEKGLRQQGTAAEVARKKQANLKGALEQLSGSWEMLKIVVGRAMIGPLTVITKKLTGVVNATSKGAGALQKAFQAGGIEGVVSKLDDAVGAGGKLSAVFLGFGQGIRGDLLTPLGGVGTAAQDIGGAFRAAWDAAKVFLLGFRQGASGDLLTPLNGVGSAAQDIGAKFRDAWPAIKKFVREFDFGKAFSQLKEAAAGLSPILGVVGDALANPAVQKAGVAVLGLGIAYKGLNAVTGGAVGGVVAFGVGVGKAGLLAAQAAIQYGAYRTAKLTLAAATTASTTATGANTVVSQINTAATNVSTLSLIRARVAQIASAGATKAMAVATGVATGAQWALNAAMSANPIALVVLAIAGLVAAFVVAYKKVEWFRDGVDAAFGWLKTAAGNVARAVGGALSGMWDGVVDGARAAANLIIGVYNKAFDVINSLTPGPIKVAGETIVPAIPDIPRIPELAGAFTPRSVVTPMATGGVVRQAGWAVVGERGPELLRMPAGATVFDDRQTAHAVRGRTAPAAGGARTAATHGGGPDAEMLLAAVREALEGVVLEVHSHLESDGREMARSVRRVAVRDALARSAT